MTGLFSLSRRDNTELSCSLGLPFFGHMWSCEHGEMVAKRRGLRMKSTSLALWSWTYLYPEFWKLNVCYLSHSTYSTCYGNPKWLNKIGKILVLSVIACILYLPSSFLYNKYTHIFICFSIWFFISEILCKYF